MSNSAEKMMYVVGGAVGALVLQVLLHHSWKERKEKRYHHPEKRKEEMSVSSSFVSLGEDHPYVQLRDEDEECIYMDYNATTPIWMEVIEVMRPFMLTCFGNPSSPHVFALPCKTAMEEARKHVGRLINSPSPEDIIFTSCGSESDNRAIDIAISSYLHSYKEMPVMVLPHVITSAIEHPAVLEYLTYLAKVENRIELTIVPVDEEGFVSPNDISQAIQYNTALVTIMHSNNEVGTIQPIRQIGEVVASYNASLHMTSGAAHKVMFHSDGAQSIGKVLIDVQREKIDILTIVGHKFGAPKGIAALYVKEGIDVTPLLHGGGQERGRRAGTENVMFNAAIGEASRIALEESTAMMIHLLRLKRHFVKNLLSSLSSYGKDFVRFNGPLNAYDIKRIDKSISYYETMEDDDDYFNNQFFPSMLPNTISVGFKGILASKLIDLLKSKVACSAGTTCHACHEENSLSTVLSALKVPESYGLGTLRISFGRHTTIAAVDGAISHVTAAINAVKNGC